MCVNLEIGEIMDMIMCTYTPKIGCNGEEKDVFWKCMESVIMRIPDGEGPFIREYLNHLKKTPFK